MQTAPQYSYEQILTYEVARDLLNTYVADCSAEIGIEFDKAVPSVGRLTKLKELMFSLILEREAMSMTNDAAMQEVLAKYRRTPTATNQSS